MGLWFNRFAILEPDAFGHTAEKRIEQVDGGLNTRATEVVPKPAYSNRVLNRSCCCRGKCKWKAIQKSGFVFNNSEA